LCAVVFVIFGGRMGGWVGNSLGVVGECLLCVVAKASVASLTVHRCWQTVLGLLKKSTLQI